MTASNRTPDPARRAMPARAWLAVAAALLVAGPAANAQSGQAIVFQHGILSDAGTWELNANRLAAVYDFTPYRFTTGAQSAYENQASVLLAGMASLPSSTIAVAHSNGGIVSREASKQRALRGIVTVATPHAGAGIMRNLADGTFDAYISYFTGTTALPITWYAEYYDTSDAWYYGAQAAAYWRDFGQWFSQLPSLLGALYAPLVQEMIPGSGYNQALNGGANLAHEASVVPSRVGITATLGDYDGMVFRSLFSTGSTHTLRDIRSTARGSLMAAYFYYTFYDDYYDPYVYAKQYYAYMWADAADALGFMDGDWCYLIGAAANWPPYAWCTENDAIVPAASQTYPNGTAQLSITGVSHVEETASDPTYVALHGVLAAGPLAVPRRYVPPPLWVSLAPYREYLMTEPGYYTWTGSAAGGDGPLTISWEVKFYDEFIDYGASETLTLYFMCPQWYDQVTVRVKVTDAAGRTATAENPFAVDTRQSPGCYY